MDSHNSINKIIEVDSQSSEYPSSSSRLHIMIKDNNADINPDNLPYSHTNNLDISNANDSNVDVRRSEPLSQSIPLNQSATDHNRSDISGSDSSSIESDDMSILEPEKVKSLMKIIMSNYKEEKKAEARQMRVIETKAKIWKVVRQLKHERGSKKGNHGTLLGKIELRFSQFIMHPELSKSRLVIDTCLYILIFVDLLLSPYEYMVIGVGSDNSSREIGFDIIFFLGIISNFFTAFFMKQVLVTNFRQIALNYSKFNLIIDILYVFPFWIFDYKFIYMRFIKIYKYFMLLRRIQTLLMYVFSFVIKSLKKIHSIVSILIFTITLIYILHYSACLYVYIGKYGHGQPNWIDNNGFSDLSNIDLYTVSVYLFIETFTTIGYGDIVPKSNLEYIYIMICEIINVGLFAYLVSCILEILSNLSTDELSFKLNSDTDIDSWLIKYNKFIPSKMKAELVKEESPTFEEIKKYFVMFYKMDYLWLNNFDFLRQMRPRERHEVLEHTFSVLYDNFKSFFMGLDTAMKNAVAINLRTKIVEPKGIILCEKEGSKKNLIRHLYFIGKGKVGVFRDTEHITTFTVGSYFGDEYLIDKYAKLTYMNIDDTDAYIFTVPISLITDLCSRYDQSYLFLLYKAMTRHNKIKLLQAEELKLIENKDEVNQDKEGNNLLSRHTTQDFAFGINNKTYNENSPNKKYSQRGFPYDNTNTPLKNEETFSIFQKNLTINEANNCQAESLLSNEFNIDELDVNVENLGSMGKLNERKKKFEDNLSYALTLEKKMEFLQGQMDFIYSHYDVVKNKTKNIIDSFKKNEKHFTKTK